jgi:hypothetical protein
MGNAFLQRKMVAKWHIETDKFLKSFSLALASYIQSNSRKQQNIERDGGKKVREVDIIAFIGVHVVLEGSQKRHYVLID